MDFKNFDKKWAKYWVDNKTFHTDVYDFSKPKYYVLDMFPYPSGNGLHVGHVEGYTATDIMARMKKMQGYNVFHPMGFDSFGLPAEQYAINTGNHPGTFTNQNIETYIKQLQKVGMSYDWDKVISTADPSFYKWTQWIFKQLFNEGYAKLIDTQVNWCEELGTVLANDEIIDGKSERGGYPVVKKILKQWVLDIPSYAEKLLADLHDLDWPESTKEMQRNWIGKSVGATIDFKVNNQDHKFTVFTTRPDTLFGATYCVLSPEHKLVDIITTNEQKVLVEEYKKAAAQKSDLERTDLNKNKTGVFTGAYAINPVNKALLPIYIADYVLNNYGTGAIMAVPAHDGRDFEFAKKFGLEIIQVLDGESVDEKAMEGDGLHINSDFLNGLNKEDAINKMLEWLEQNGVGKKSINYKLREWVFARQRYWGEPIPVLHLEDGRIVALDDKDLPLELPEVKNYEPKGAISPLEEVTDWVNVKMPDGSMAKRETSTMPGSAGSSWYFARYIDSKNDKEFANYELLKHWMPVDLYLGGAEHSVGHLLYSRFWNKFLYDQGYMPVSEPFKKLVHPGIVLGHNGEKMSKSKGNVVNPDDIIEEYGADTLRLYEMFMGPLKDAKPWNHEGIMGSKRFLERVWRLYVEDNKIQDAPNSNLEKLYHETVKKVTHDFEEMLFNTGISQLMIFINAVYKESVFPLVYAKGFIKLLNPIAPFMTEEIWQKVFGAKESIATEKWPTYDEKYLIDDSFECVIQVNGRIKAKVIAPVDSTQEQVVNIIKSSEHAALLDGEIKKIIFVKNRILNIIV